MSEQLLSTGRLHLVPRMSGGSLLLAGALSFCASCSKHIERPAFPTFPVTGQVVTRGDPLPVGGCVEFESQQHGLDYTAMGVIDSEGRFTLSVPFVDRVIPGATEGPHAVRVMLPIDDGGGVVRIRELLNVEPRENHFTISMPKAHRN